MEERDQILIDRYLAGELTQAEIRDLDRRLAEDPAFDAEVSALEEARQALKIKQREELKERFRKRDEVLDKKKPETPVLVKYRLTWVWIAAAVICGLLIWRFLLSDLKQTLPVNAESTDTSRYQETPVVRIDTIEQGDSLRQQSPPEKPRPPKQDMATNNQQGQALFAEYYEPYKDALMDPTTRGDENLSTLQQFQKAYWENDYTNAARLFPQVPEQYRSNDNYRFMYANALLANGNIDKAIPFFKEIIEQNKSRYRTESMFSLALAELKKNNKKEATQWLETYIRDEKAKQKDKAIALQTALKNIPEK